MCGGSRVRSIPTAWRSLGGFVTPGRRSPLWTHGSARGVVGMALPMALPETPGPESSPTAPYRKACVSKRKRECLSV